MQATELTGSIRFLTGRLIYRGPAINSTSLSWPLEQGGVHGVGLGESRQKMFYLPEAHTDFVFAVVGEETGLWGYHGHHTPFWPFGGAGALGRGAPPDAVWSFTRIWVYVLSGLPGGLNMGVAVGLLPITGLPLPFVSYGGSALVMILIYIGMLLGLSREVQRRNIAYA